MPLKQLWPPPFTRTFWVEHPEGSHRRLQCIHWVTILGEALDQLKKLVPEVSMVPEVGVKLVEFLLAWKAIKQQEIGRLLKRAVFG